MGALVTQGEFDAVVIGAGFGGLGAALRLSELGARVVVLEALNYPGGCASTFTRSGYRFEAGATLFSGFGPNQPFQRWIDDYRLNVQVDMLDPMVELRTPDRVLKVGTDRTALIDQLAACPGADRGKLNAFFAEQVRVADALWALFEDPALLPPFSLSALLTHVARVPRYLPILRVAGRPLGSVLARHGLADFEPLRTYLDALCQITVQCSAAEAEAPFAMSTMDYYFRGTGHVHGGIGVLAEGLVQAIRSNGGDVRYASRVKGVNRNADGTWRVTTRHGELRSKTVIGNVLPHDLANLMQVELSSHPRLARWANQVESGWGAVMLYLVVAPPPDAPPQARHLELVPDPHRPFTEGHHLFCSISAANESRAPSGLRTMTVSTHVPLADLRQQSSEAQAARIHAIQTRMQQGLKRLAPEWMQDVRFLMTASPRTFERFTRRFGGYVGGVPRRAGWRLYQDLVPAPVAPGLYLVGDTVFPGQSTLATAIGGVKVAERAYRAHLAHAEMARATV